MTPKTGQKINKSSLSLILALSLSGIILAAYAIYSGTQQHSAWITWERGVPVFPSAKDFFAPLLKILLASLFSFGCAATSLILTLLQKKTDENMLRTVFILINASVLALWLLVIVRLSL